MIKILLDQGLPHSAAGVLRAHGFDAQHVSERGMSKAEDAAILQVGLQEKRVVVTLDADFHTLLAVAGASKPSVLRIRMQGLKAEPIATLIERVLELARDELNQGAMVTLADGKIRIKLLPITK